MDVKDIKDPGFLKEYGVSECEALAEDIRRFLIDTLAGTGGHFSSNLGVVELTIALHKHFDSPHDKLVFDVGHQGYVHKILTGRAEQFDTLRKTDGLSGFLKRAESEHDVYEAGHSSTSVAASAGMLFAKGHADIGHVVAIIGDGALQSGVALEALNFLGHYPQHQPIIVLNDNEMSIGENVGMLSKLLTNVRMRRGYRRIRRRARSLVPNRFRNFTSRIERRVKGFLTGYTYFESVGYDYFGPIDGHDFKQLFKAFEVAKRNDRPTVIHVRTVKGKGYTPAEKDKQGVWHGVSGFEKANGRLKTGGLTYSNLAADYMLNRLDSGKDAYVVTPAMVPGSKLMDFKEKHPDRLIDTGIAEATALTMAGSLAMQGVDVFLTVYSTFLQRAYDQLLHDVARHGAPVVIGVDRSGLVGADGDTHQGIYDLPMTLHIPNLTIAHPKNPEEFVRIMNYAFDHCDGPFLVRYSKETCEYSADVVNTQESYPPGWMEERQGRDATVIAFGTIVEELSEIFAHRGLDVRLLNARYLKPLDEKTLSTIDPEVPLVVHEESTLQGGFGSAVADYFLERPAPRIVRLGFTDTYVEHGSRNTLLRRYGLDAKSVADTVEALIDAA